MSSIAKESSQFQNPCSSGPGPQGEKAKDSSLAGTRAVISSHCHSRAPPTLFSSRQESAGPSSSVSSSLMTKKAGLSVALHQHVTGSPESHQDAESSCSSRFPIWQSKVTEEPKIHLDTFPSLAPSRANVHKALAKHRKVESSENFSRCHHP